MSQDPDQIRADIERTRAELSSDVDQLTDQANPKRVAQRKVEDAKQSVVGLKDRLMGSNTDHGSVGGRAKDATSSVQSRTQGNPLAAGTIAFGIGLLIAGLIPSSSKEQKAAAQLKDAATPVTEQLTESAKEVGQNLQAPAQDAAASVKATATDAAQTVREEGQGAARTVQGQAVESTERVQDTRS